jgi:HlyD family secretion protein
MDSKLFLIAKNLELFEILAGVPEVSVGKVRPGQAAHFTASVFPEKVFTGSVRQVRLNATVTQLKVTYTAVIAISDSDSAQLLPFMTAKITLDPPN